MPEQSTLEALSDPESDVYQCYARALDKEGWAAISTERRGQAFADAWTAYSGNGRRCSVVLDRDEGWIVEVLW